jgi:hypothetical protein
MSNIIDNMKEGSFCKTHLLVAIRVILSAFIVSILPAGGYNSSGKQSGLVFWVRNPLDVVHSFHSKLSTYSGRSCPVIPV